MKISFIAENDWANVLTEYSYCLNKHSKNIEAKSICLNKHSFNYTIQHDYDLSDCTYDQGLEAQKFIFESDVIIFGEEGAMQPTNYKVLEIYKQILGLDLLNSDKKLLIWHPGTHYRQNFSFYNNHPLRNRLHKHLYAMDLYRLSPKTQNDTPLLLYKYENFNIDKLLENFIKKLNNKPRIVLHIPSNPLVKGTSFITNSMKNLPKGYVYKTFSKISNLEVLSHKNEALFYIDQINDIGTYGTSAYESLLNSSIVFSSLQNSIEGILKLTGENVLPIVDLKNNPTQIEQIIHNILNLSDNELINIYKGILGWMEKYYSPMAIEKNISKIIL